MATRRSIRENFYTELESAAGTLLSTADIGQEYPESSEDLPTIVHNDNYRRVPMNTNTGPTAVDKSGTGVTYYYSLPMEAQFTVLIMSQSETEKEALYNAVRAHFEEFTIPLRHPSEIHGDVHRVAVLDVSSSDEEGRDPTARGDSLTISLGYERILARDESEIETVEQNFSAGITDFGDSEPDITYTTN